MEETPAAPVNPNAVSPAPITAEFTTPAPVSTTYESNPFLAVAKGMVSILHYNPGPALLMSLAVMLIGLAGFVVIMLPLLLIHNIFVSILFGVIGFVAYFAFIGLSIGTYLSVGGASSRGQKTTLKASMRRAVDRLLPLVGVCVLAGLLVTIGFILLVVPGFWLLGRLSLAGVVLLEEDLGPVAALKRSWALTKGHAVEMLGALFAAQMIGAGGLGLLTPTVAIAPLYARYTDLIALGRTGTVKPKTHWLNYLAFVAILPLVALGVFIGLVAGGVIKTPSSTDTNGVMQLPGSTSPSLNGGTGGGSTLQPYGGGSGSAINGVGGTYGSNTNGGIGGSGTNVPSFQ